MPPFLVSTNVPDIIKFLQTKMLFSAIKRCWFRCPSRFDAQLDVYLQRRYGLKTVPQIIYIQSLYGEFLQDDLLKIVSLTYAEDNNVKVLPPHPPHMEEYSYEEKFFLLNPLDYHLNDHQRKLYAKKPILHYHAKATQQAIVNSLLMYGLIVQPKFCIANNVIAHSRLNAFTSPPTIPIMSNEFFLKGIFHHCKLINDAAIRLFEAVPAGLLSSLSFDLRNRLGFPGYRNLGVRIKNRLKKKSHKWIVRKFKGPRAVKRRRNSNANIERIDQEEAEVLEEALAMSSGGESSGSYTSSSSISGSSSSSGDSTVEGSVKVAIQRKPEVDDDEVSVEANPQPQKPRGPEKPKKRNLRHPFSSQFMPQRQNRLPSFRNKERIEFVNSVREIIASILAKLMKEPDYAPRIIKHSYEATKRFFELFEGCMAGEVNGSFQSFDKKRPYDSIKNLCQSFAADIFLEVVNPEHFKTAPKPKAELNIAAFGRQRNVKIEEIEIITNQDPAEHDAYLRRNPVVASMRNRLQKRPFLNNIMCGNIAVRIESDLDSPEVPLSCIGLLVCSRPVANGVGGLPYPITFIGNDDLPLKFNFGLQLDQLHLFRNRMDESAPRMTIPIGDLNFQPYIVEVEGGFSTKVIIHPETEEQYPKRYKFNAKKALPCILEPPLASCPWKFSDEFMLPPAEIPYGEEKVIAPLPFMPHDKPIELRLYSHLASELQNWKYAMVAAARSRKCQVARLRMARWEELVAFDLLDKDHFLTHMSKCLCILVTRVLMDEFGGGEDIPGQNRAEPTPEPDSSSSEEVGWDYRSEQLRKLEVRKAQRKVKGWKNAKDIFVLDWTEKEVLDWKNKQRIAYFFAESYDFQYQTIIGQIMRESIPGGVLNIIPGIEAFLELSMPLAIAASEASQNFLSTIVKEYEELEKKFGPEKARNDIKDKLTEAQQISSKFYKMTMKADLCLESVVDYRRLDDKITDALELSVNRVVPYGNTGFDGGLIFPDHLHDRFVSGTTLSTLNDKNLLNLWRPDVLRFYTFEIHRKAILAFYDVVNASFSLVPSVLIQPKKEDLRGLRDFCFIIDALHRRKLGIFERESELLWQSINDNILLSEYETEIRPSLRRIMKVDNFQFDPIPSNYAALDRRNKLSPLLSPELSVLEIMELACKILNSTRPLTPTEIPTIDARTRGIPREDISQADITDDMTPFDVLKILDSLHGEEETSYGSPETQRLDISPNKHPWQSYISLPEDKEFRIQWLNSTFPYVNKLFQTYQMSLIAPLLSSVTIGPEFAYNACGLSATTPFVNERHIRLPLAIISSVPYFLHFLEILDLLISKFVDEGDKTFPSFCIDVDLPVKMGKKSLVNYFSLVHARFLYLEQLSVQLLASRLVADLPRILNSLEDYNWSLDQVFEQLQLEPRLKFLEKLLGRFSTQASDRVKGRCLSIVVHCIVSWCLRSVGAIGVWSSSGNCTYCLHEFEFAPLYPDDYSVPEEEVFQPERPTQTLNQCSTVLKSLKSRINSIHEEATFEEKFVQKCLKDSSNMIEVLLKKSSCGLEELAKSFISADKTENLDLKSSMDNFSHCLFSEGVPSDIQNNQLEGLRTLQLFLCPNCGIPMDNTGPVPTLEELQMEENELLMSGLNPRYLIPKTAYRGTSKLFESFCEETEPEAVLTAVPEALPTTETSITEAVPTETSITEAVPTETSITEAVPTTETSISETTITVPTEVPTAVPEAATSKTEAVPTETSITEAVPTSIQEQTDVLEPVTTFATDAHVSTKAPISDGSFYDTDDIDCNSFITPNSAQCSMNADEGISIVPGPSLRFAKKSEDKDEWFDRSFYPSEWRVSWLRPKSAVLKKNTCPSEFYRSDSAVPTTRLPKILNDFLCQPFRQEKTAPRIAGILATRGEFPCGVTRLEEDVIRSLQCCPHLQWVDGQGNKVASFISSRPTEPPLQTIDDTGLPGRELWEACGWSPLRLEWECQQTGLSTKKSAADSLFGRYKERFCEIRENPFTGKMGFVVYRGPDDAGIFDEVSLDPRDPLHVRSVNWVTPDDKNSCDLEIRITGREHPALKQLLIKGNDFDAQALRICLRGLSREDSELWYKIFNATLRDLRTQHDINSLDNFKRESCWNLQSISSAYPIVFHSWIGSVNF
eukprot:GHVP01050906.1.p1 GENE.GHVP01050906.1~~GHVP01050906.1.p1  ORF type:complete len:2288 (+),score=382.96 GHVP01050906.1:467-6865(+)